jgi:hypothetical protein
MKYIFAVVLLITWTALKAEPLKLRLYADTNNTKTADADTVIRKQSATIGVSYGSDLQFFGRTGPVTYPFASADAIYNFKNGVFLYGSGVKVLGYDPFVAEIDLGGGYVYNISKQWIGSASYTRFLFNKDAAQVIKSASANDLNLNNSYNWNFAKSGIILDYLFGKASDAFVTINTSKYFESKFSIFDDKDYMTFTPAIAAIFGTQNFVQRYADDHEYQEDVNNLFYSNPNVHNMAHNNGLFKLLDYNIKLPIAYNRPHYTFEFSYKYSIPLNVEGLLMNHRESFYNLTFYYVFF